MTHSLNEIEAMAKKAARGGGYSWGIAEEAGKAVRWLESHGLPGVASLACHLETGAARGPDTLDGIWTAQDGALCPLLCGASLNDCADQMLGAGQIEIAQVARPLLLLPFAAWSAVHLKASVAVSWDAVSIVTDGFNMNCTDQHQQIASPEPVTLVCRRAASGHAQLSQPAMRGHVNASAWARLGALAHRTYAPATEESRLLGAGAGVSDND
jgi:hypothetical protein